jgi:mannose/cellobiose epimerase-like protein (N-acyl-D-glucosamine 2-epimerase family)
MGGQHSGESTESRLLASRITDVRSWLYGHALPLWGDVGVDENGGFVEQLTLDGNPLDIGYKRLRLQARQVYVFSQAHLNGYPTGLETARRGWDFMRRYGWLPDGGWARRLGTHGEVLDPTLDLYDQASVLFAIAWWIKASADRSAVTFADRTLYAVDRRLGLSGRIGWMSERGPGAALLQNPHMHLLEALLALFDATGEVRFRARASTVLDLFESAFFDARTGTLAEYYEGPWRRSAGQRGRIVEPGHHYEWVWLLHQGAATISSSDDRADALFEFAERFGRGHGGSLILDEVLSNGMPCTPSYRLWATAEALKAHLARFESRGTLDVGRITGTIDVLFRHFLGAPRPGVWIDRFSARLEPTVKTVPASSLYHLVLAFSELLRLEPRLRAAGALA